MGIVDQYQAAAVQFTAWAMEGVGMVKEDWPEIGMRIDTDLDSVALPFLQDFPLLREWIGDKIVKDMKENVITVRPPDFESTIGVPVRALQTNQLGHYRAMIQTYPVMAGKDRDSRFWAKLLTGFTVAGYDAVTFFNANHPIAGGAVNDNLATTNYQLNATSYGLSIGKLRAMKSYNGRCLNLSPTHLVVAPDLEVMARGIINTQFAPTLAGGENVWQGSAKLIVRSDLTAKHWFVVDASYPIRPMVEVVRGGEPVFLAAEDLLTEHRWKRNEAQFSVECSHESEFGPYQLIVGSTGAGAAP